MRAVAVSTGVEDGNTVERSGSPTGITEVVFADSFENGNLGWTFARGTPAASAGDFVIGDPVGTIGNNSQPSQPEDDHTAAPGVACLYTAPNPAGSVGADDVDNGEVVATSRVINLSGYSAATLSLWRWFENEDPDDAGDYYVLEVSNNGTTWVPLETIPDTVTTTNTWTRVQFDLQAFVTLTSTMRIRFRVADGPALGDIVEFAADDIEITGNRSCTAGATVPPPVGDGKGDDAADAADERPAATGSRSRWTTPPARTTTSSSWPGPSATSAATSGRRGLRLRERRRRHRADHGDAPERVVHRAVGDEQRRRGPSG